MAKKSPMFLIFLTVFIDLVGFGIIIPLGPFYAEKYGATPTQVGLLMASYSVMQFIFAPIWGRVSDRIGRRPILLMSILGSAISYFVFGFAEALWVLFLSRMLQGLFGANFGAAFAYVADITTKENRAKGMGLVGAALGMGFIVGPALGAFLSEWGPHVGNFLGYSGYHIFGMGFPAICAGFLSLTNFIMAYFRLPESLSEEVRSRLTKPESRWSFFKRSMKKPELSWLISMFFISTVGIAAMEATLALFVERRLDFGIPETGRLFAFAGLMMAFTQGYLLRKFLPKFGERKLIVWGPLIAAVGLGSVAFANSLGFVLVSMSLFAIGGGITNPVVSAGVSLVTDESEQGAVMGLNQGLSSLGRIVGPSMGGYLFTHMGPGAPYILAGLLMFIAGALAITNVKKLPENVRK